MLTTSSGQLLLCCLCRLGSCVTAGLCVCVRLLKDNLQHSQFTARYHHLLAALLCCVGRGLREEFDRQCWLVSILANVAHRVRDAAPSSRQVGPLTTLNRALKHSNVGFSEQTQDSVLPPTKR